MFETSLDRVAVGKRLLEIRHNLGLSRDNLAKKLNVSRTTIQLYEGGERSPTADVLWAYHLLFGINIQWIITGKGEEKHLSGRPLAPREEILLEQLNGMPDEVVNRLIDFLVSVRRN